MILLTPSRPLNDLIDVPPLQINASNDLIDVPPPFQINAFLHAFKFVLDAPL